MRKRSDSKFWVMFSSTMFSTVNFIDRIMNLRFGRRSSWQWRGRGDRKWNSGRRGGSWSGGTLIGRGCRMRIWSEPVRNWLNDNWWTKNKIYPQISRLHKAPLLSSLNSNTNYSIGRRLWLVEGRLMILWDWSQKGFLRHLSIPHSPFPPALSLQTTITGDKMCLKDGHPYCVRPQTGQEEWQ